MVRFLEAFLILMLSFHIKGSKIFFLIIASAVATSTYADNDGCYGPKFAIDGYSDSTGCNFFHSKATVPYPYLAATINALGQSITSVTLKSRCDANGWGHTQINLVVRYIRTDEL